MVVSDPQFAGKEDNSVLKTCLIGAALLVYGALATMGAVSAAEEGDQRAIAKDYYVDCQHRVAARFRAKPAIRDLQYSEGGKMFPAREYHLEQGMDRFSVTVVDFTKGPAADDTIVENAVAPFRKLGDIQEQQPEDYAPGLPGRQLVIFTPDSRQHRVTIYMANHRLYISDAFTARGDYGALQFDQSVVIIGPDGADQNNFVSSLRYPCGK